MTINIITPSCRPENLLRVINSISIPCKWWIVYDSETPIKQFNRFWINELNIKGGVSGNLQRNLALDKITDHDSWCYFLDDDNIMHKDFNKLVTVVESLSNIECIIFGQDLGNGTQRIPDPNNIRVCHIDQAQFLIKRSLIGDKRYIQQYEADGIFFEQIYNEHKDKCLITSNIFSHYNYLKQ